MRPWVTSRPRFPIAFPTAPPVTSHGVCRSLSAPAGTSIRTGWQMAIPSAGSSSTGRHVGLPASRRNSANADASTRIIRRSSCGARRGRWLCVPHTNDAPPACRFHRRCRTSCEPSVWACARPSSSDAASPVHRPGVDHSPGGGPHPAFPRRSVACSWGRRESNPHWGRFKRPASADWATSPLDGGSGSGPPPYPRTLPRRGRRTPAAAGDGPSAQRTSTSSSRYEWMPDTKMSRSGTASGSAMIPRLSSST